MTEEWEDNGTWVPLTPVTVVCIDKDLNQNVENPLIPPIWGKLGHVENCGCQFGDHGNNGLGRTEVAENHGGLGKSAEDCGGGIAAVKAGFMNSGNAGISPESLGYSGTQEGAVGGIPDEGGHQQTTEPLAWKEEIQLHNDNLHHEFGSGLTKASSLQKKQSPKKRSNMRIDSNEKPRKRRRMKKHRPKVFDETKPKKPSTLKPWTPRVSTATPQTPRPSTPKPRTCRPKTTKLRTPSPPTPNPKTPRRVTPRRAKYVKNDHLNIPVSCLNDVGFSGHGKICSIQKLDFSMGNHTVDLNPKVSDGIQNKLEVTPELHSDNRVDHLQVSQRKQKLDFSMGSCTVNQNSKACDGIENKQELEPKLHSHNRVNCIRVYQRRKKLEFNKENDIMDHSSKACNGVENELEVKPKLHSDDGVNCPQVYHRRRKLDFSLENCMMDQNLNACDGVEDKLELEPKQYSDNRFNGLQVYRRRFRANECLSNSRKLGPNFPYIYKRNRTRRQKATAYVKFIALVQTKRPRRKSSKKKSFTACVSMENFPRKAVENPAVHKCNLNVKWNVSFKKKRSRTSTGRRNLSCFVKGFPVMVNYKRTRSKTPCRRQDFSSFINFSTVQASEPLIQEKNVILDCEKHLLELDSVGLHYKDTQHDQKNLSSRNYFKEALIDFVCQRMENLHFHTQFTQLVARDQSVQGALVTSKGKYDPFRRRKQLPRVDLDEETTRVWNLLIEDKWSEETEELDDDKKKYWEEQREIFKGRVDAFLARMRLIQGDRQFSPWKGSVVDSVVGVFLTQNVSDNLSSSAFMALAAKYPPPTPSSQENSCDGGSECVIKEIQDKKLVHSPSSRGKELFIMEEYPLTTPSNDVGLNPESGNNISFQTESTSGEMEENVKDKQENEINWDDLRAQNSHGRSRKRTSDTQDSVDWDAVRRAPVADVAKEIMERGMNNMLAARIKDFLDRIVRDHGSIDLEWLRDVPPEKAKEYLLSITGLGLKSVECVRLLSLRHHAFPVDTNVARILVRLGWVPLKPLPGDIQIHLLNDYPMLDSIQKYVWPRLCKRNQLILYECHYQMITFAKAFCTKINPNCNACPMRGECRHFASANASAKLRLEDSRDKNRATESSGASGHDPMEYTDPLLLADSHDEFPEGRYNSSNCEPIIEFPSSPEPVCIEPLERDMEDFGYECSSEEIPTIKLTIEEYTEQVESFIGEEDMSNALLALCPGIASIPMPKLKEVARLRTVHHVYELPDSHPLLAGFEKRETDDPCPYLLAIWTTDESTNSDQDLRRGYNCQEPVCNMAACCSGEIVQYENDRIVRGTILIPCRTANRGSFPLNGTYFQVNEVFADHESSRHPIPVPREWIWNLRRRPLYCGTSATSVAKGMLIEEIVYMFRRGFICVRGFNRTNRAPRSLSRRFHVCKSRKANGS